MKVPYLSASRIELYEGCARKYYYIYECGMKTTMHPSAHIGTAVHEALEKFISDKANLYTAYDNAIKKIPAVGKDYYEDGLQILKHLESRGIIDSGVKVIATEKPFDLTLDNGVRIKGYIDRIDERDSNTLEITDYKTTKWPYTAEQIDKDIQVGIYNLVVRENLYPQYPIIVVTFDFVRFGRQSTVRTPAQLSALKRYLRVVYDKIQADDGQIGTVSDKCRWCDFRGICPDYKKKIEEPSIDVVDMSKYSDEELIKILCDDELKITLLESKASRIKEYFKDKLMSSDSIAIKAPDGSKVYFKSRALKTIYNEDTIKEILKSKNIPAESVMTFDKDKVDSVLNDTDSQGKLAKTARITFARPSIKLRSADEK